MTWPPPRSVKKPRAHDEDDLQVAVVEFLELALPPQAGVFWSATLNGVKVSPKSVSRLRKLGLRPGVLDLIFIPLVGDLVGNVYLIELKTATGRPTPEQKKIVDALYPHGRACFARSVEQVCAALVAWSFPLRARV